MRKIKKDDQVIVISGKDKGKIGPVKSWTVDKVVVGGINLIKKHTKPNPQMGVSGGIVEREAAIAVSNVAIYNAKSKKADRVGFELREDKKVRVYKSSGELIDS